MRQLNSIIIHCSATKAGQDFTAADIDRWHRRRGFNGIGYHYVIRLNGQIEKGRDLSLVGAHCKGWNERSIGICYIGGLDANGHPADTRTPAQKRVLYQLIMDLQRQYNILQVLGHRDTSPDLNGDGVIEPCEYIKSCPCFSVKEFLKNGRELLFILLLAFCLPIFLSGCRSSKEVISKSSRVELDSSSVVSETRKWMTQSFVTENDSEVVEEHIEQTVFVVPCSVDTFVGRLGMVVRMVVDRRIGKGRVASVERTFRETDSLYMDSNSKKEVLDEMESEVKKKGTCGWWKIGMVVCVGGFMGYFAFKWRWNRRKFY